MLNDKKPRFLVTTSDQRSWRKEKPVLFLGEWCKWYDTDNNYWNGVDSDTVPAYGIQSNQKKLDRKYINHLYEVLLEQLHNELNRIHGTNHTLRYWRILLGSWLSRYTTITYNRWQTIQYVANNYNILNTIILEIPESNMIPFDFLSFARLIRVGDWDHAIYSEIIKEYTDIPYVIVSDFEKNISTGPEFTLDSIPNSKLSIKNKLLGLSSFLSKIFGKSTDALIITSCLPLINELKLHLSLGQIPIPQRSLKLDQFNPNIEFRNKLDLKHDDYTGFEEFIRKSIEKQIPILYLDGYSTLIRKAKNLNWPANPAFIFTANSFDEDELFKVWTAEKIESGTPYIIGQHGANYGTSDYAPSEFQEVETADRFITWGWSYNKNKHYPVGAFPLLGKKKNQYNPKGDILLVERGGGHRVHPWDETPLFIEYLQDQFRFVDSLTTSAKKHLTVRLYLAHLYLSWSENEIWESKYSDVTIDYGNTSMSKLIKNSRLAIYTYNSTGILECLALNTPTIFFWNFESWPIRCSAKSAFEILAKAGICHTTPLSAANKVTEVWGNIPEWWGSDEIQRARISFCESYAFLSSDILSKLKNALVTTI